MFVSYACAKLLGGDAFETTIICGIGTLLGFMFCYLRKRQFLNNNFYRARKYFTDHGNAVDFELRPQLLISSSTKQLAIVNGYAGTYDAYPFSGILGWEHSWTNKTEAESNVWGDKVNGRTRATKNVLTLKTNNPHKPIYQFHLFAHSHGELWMARFDALFNIH